MRWFWECSVLEVRCSGNHAPELFIVSLARAGIQGFPEHGLHRRDVPEGATVVTVAGIEFSAYLYGRSMLRPYETPLQGLGHQCSRLLKMAYLVTISQTRSRIRVPLLAC